MQNFLIGRCGMLFKSLGDALSRTHQKVDQLVARRDASARKFEGRAAR